MALTCSRIMLAPFPAASLTSFSALSCNKIRATQLCCIQFGTYYHRRTHKVTRNVSTSFLGAEKKLETGEIYRLTHKNERSIKHQISR